MASHFSSIGLPLDSFDEYKELIRRVEDDSEEVQVENGYYLRWSSASGAELWIQVDSENTLVGMDPHFSGKSRVRTGITKRIWRPNGSVLDGAFYGWASPDGDDPSTGLYPFVFDAPDFVCHGDFVLPSIVTVQIAAFAHEISLFDSPEAFLASHATKPRMASQAFIPSGLFRFSGEITEPPAAEAVMTGHILETEMRTNELTGKSFLWTLVETYGGIFDVVVAPELLDTQPKVGGIVEGSFWLSGRIVRYPNDGVE